MALHKKDMDKYREDIRICSGCECIEFDGFKIICTKYSQPLSTINVFEGPRTPRKAHERREGLLFGKRPGDTMIQFKRLEMCERKMVGNGKTD